MAMQLSKALIDRAGRLLADTEFGQAEEYIEYESVFDEFRKFHLKPLSETTLEIQRWLADYGQSYYIAQRLKRKPQILRKLKRLKVRLSQLQDVGGLRIIVDTNQDVNRLYSYICDRLGEDHEFSVYRHTDYRELGRDKTGYRALHVIIRRDNIRLELQIRSRIQHYWAESIERASVIYGYYLKEEEGDPIVLKYFKVLSDAFYEIEAGRTPSSAMQIEIDSLREKCENIIKSSPRGKSFDSFVNEGIIRTMKDKEASAGSGLNNWIIVFDWNTGSFISWDIVGRDPELAVASYVQNERNFPPDSGFEVVLIGSSDVATVRETHSHYFGIASYDYVLESLDASIVGFRKNVDLDVGARQILLSLYSHRYWGGKTISIGTLRNHYCKKVLTFEVSLQSLIEKGLLKDGKGVSLNLQMKQEIEKYIQWQ